MSRAVCPAPRRLLRRRCAPASWYHCRISGSLFRALCPAARRNAALPVSLAYNKDIINIWNQVSVDITQICFFISN